MPQSSSLRRLLETQLDECCDADVADRVRELESLDEAVPTDPSADLDALSTLGNETRYRLVSLLVAAADELCVCELSPLVDVSDSAISHALSDLTDAGLVTRRKEGTWRYYRSTERAEVLVAALDATRGEGSD
ncbi:putative transcriptional regulator [Halovivax ruber XH-70]|uniref:Putative transcriptional regulator n=1 Tax=Halovivax ruber (strain DSM 18193 / JCM 13892 / XH-70) TaxID=797302 RepID=L0I704_HALRX|nr:metalloregulator ArsR/SmtB family transcription factor [Halovivax ruber]AGB15315.1 putative transcriptional regulator [Halovivax ruber XH-70]